MQSDKFIRIARKVANEDTALFDTLMEFERTKKIRTKKRVNFTVDKNILSKFKKFCRERGYNMSAKIEKAMREMLEKKG